MCLAVPLKILSVEGKQAVGEAGGLTQKLRVDFVPDIRPGDYAMVHAGCAIEKLTEQQALENLACIQEAVDAAE